MAAPQWSRLLRSRWRWAASVALLAVMAWAGLRLFVRQDETLRRVQESRVWRVALDPSFPPFESLDPATNRPAGFDVDLAQAIAAHWGVTVELVPAGFDELVDAVAAHRVDSAISALPVVPSRTREVLFSAPYIEAGLVLVAPPGASITGTMGLAGRRVAVEWGSEGDAQARALARTLQPAPTILPRESPEAALTTTVAGEADAALVDAISLALFNRGGRRLAAVGAPVRSDPYVVVVPHDAPGLVRSINEALSALAADGTLARLRARWLGAD